MPGSSWPVLGNQPSCTLKINEAVSASQKVGTETPPRLKTRIT